MKFKTLAVILALFQPSSGHGLVNRWTDMNTTTSAPGWDFWKKPKTAAWYCENGDNGFVDHKSINTPEIICHRKGAPGVDHFTVRDGDGIQMEWNAWADSHKGPLISFIAPCPGDCTKVDKTSLRWTKIEESGFDGGKWATDVMLSNGKRSYVRIPQGLKAGNYVLRHEAIALHGARNQDAQFYPQCINLKVTGSGSAVPNNGVPGVALYGAREPGLIFDLYGQKYTSYPIPGPKPWTGR
jgi:lytic cellulose monooxygenase (C1-hydroxylating)